MISQRIFDAVYYFCIITIVIVSLILVIKILISIFKFN